MPIGKKVAVVTGSTSGIGLAIAHSLAAEGCNVVVNSYSDNKDDHAIANDIATEHSVEAVYMPGRHVEAGPMPRRLSRHGRRIRQQSTFSSTMPVSSMSRRLKNSPSRNGTGSSRSTCPRPSTPPPPHCR